MGEKLRSVILRPLVGRTSNPRKGCPTRKGSFYIYMVSITPGRSGYALRHGGYNKSDLQGGPYPLNLDGSELYLAVGSDGEVELFY